MSHSIRPEGPLCGTARMPGDKSISHRYAMLAAVAEGTSELRNFAASRDCHSTLLCLREVGVEICESGENVTIKGRGLRGLKPAHRILDAGNSGTTIRILSGILAGQGFEYSITGDDSLSRRPMNRILEPLRLFGVAADSREGGLPPLRIKGGLLKALRYRLPVASAQVKSCVLLAGLYGDGTTAVQETVATRDHTELALMQFGAAVSNKEEGWIEIEPNPIMAAQRLDVPGDLSSAAFFIVAAALVPESDLFLPGVGLNPTRRALLAYLESSGLDISVENESDSAGEARGDLRIRYNDSVLRERLDPIRGDLAAALIDEIPVLAVLGSQVAGGLEISDARELRIKESDRIAALASNLCAMGVAVEEKPDGLRIPGGQHLCGVDIDTREDHRIAMAFAVAGLVALGETRIHQAECAEVSFPRFWEILDSLIRR